MAVTIYHNPHCSKSRKTLELLRERDVDLSVIEYLDTPPSEAKLRKILDLLGCGPREIMREKEAIYEELGLDDDSLSDDALIAAMLAHPILIERPIVVTDDAAVIGRPPENIDSLFED